MQGQDPIIGAIAQDAATDPPQSDAGRKLIGDIATSEQQVNIQKASQFYNLVPDLDPAKVREIGQEVFKGFRNDDDTRSDWLEMHEFWLRLYMQTDSAVNGASSERDWGATESVPILTEACDQFQSRTYKAFFPNETFVSAAILHHTQNPQERKMLQERADRVGRHMSWQLGVQNQDYKKDKRALFLGTALHGSFFTKTYFDAIKKKRIVVDNIRPTDLVINYNIGPKRICDVRRKSLIIPTTVGESKILVNKGYITEALKPDPNGGRTTYDIAVDESQGLDPDGADMRNDRSATYVEQQFYLDIDDTGQFLPYIGTIDITNGRLLRLTVDFEADAMGNPSKDYEQIQYYTHYKYMENPDGFYGLGLGAKIGDLNSAVNIGMRQTLDAATLQNDGNNSGYISERLCMDGEDEVEMVLGKLRKVAGTSEDMKNGIMMMQYPGPSAALAKAIEFLDQRAQRMAGTTEATTGSIDKNMQPTTVLAQIEQGLEQFSSVQMGLADDFGDELTKIFKLNQKHMPFVEYFSVNEVPEAVTRQDYADDMAIQPIFDPKFATQTQKMARAQAQGQIVMQNQFLAQNQMIMDEVTRRQLEAMDVDDIDTLVPPPPPPPADIDNQDAENMMFLQPPQANPPFQVYPDQHHADHLAKLEPFIKEKGHLIPPEQQQAVIAHKQMHEGFLYGQQKGLIPPPRNTNAQGMAGGGNDPMGSQAALPPVPGLQGGLPNPLAGVNSLAQLQGGMSGNA